MILKFVRAGFVPALLLLGGCATQGNQYYWGEYEPLIYDMYVNPGAADTDTQVEKLTLTIQQAQSYGMQIPPGLYAHLGMMYAKQGNPALAVEALNEEKAHYPESAKFIDGLMVRAKLQAKQEVTQ